MWWGAGRTAIAITGPVLFFAGWCLLAVIFRHHAPAVMPAPWSVAAHLPDVWRQGLWSNAVASAKVAAGGWLVGCGVAIGVGITVARIAVLRDVVVPVIELLRPISALAWVPLAVIWFGIGYNSKLFIVALATFFLVVVHVLQGAEAADARHLKVARMLSLRRRDVYRFIVIPAALPEILLGLRQGLGVAWGGVIIAELVAGDKGLGAMEINAQQSYDLNTLVIAMATFAVLGLASVWVFGMLERLAFPWLIALRRGASTGAALPSVLTSATKSSRSRQAAGAVIGIALLVAVWWTAGQWLHARAVILPTPGDVANRLSNLVQTHDFWTDFVTSLREFLLGYLIAMAAALAVSTAFVTVPLLRRALWSEIELLRFVIPFSWIPFSLLWFSTSAAGKVFIVGYAVFFSVILPTYAALSEVDGLLLKAGRMARLPMWRQLLQIRIRAALPRLMAGARVGIGVGWVAVIAAEYVGAQHGLGMFITNAQETLETTSVMAGMIVIGVVGALLSTIARSIGDLSTSRQGGSR